MAPPGWTPSGSQADGPAKAACVAMNIAPASVSRHSTALARAHAPCLLRSVMVRSPFG
jgi:hypothetical protein